MELVTWVRLQWDRVAAIAGVMLGTLMLVVGWVKVSGSPVITEQICYVVSAGLGGLFVLGVAATLWLSADFRDEWRAIDRLADAQEEANVALLAQATSVERVSPANGHAPSGNGHDAVLKSGSRRARAGRQV